MRPTSMTLLLNKIERRLGTSVLNLPDQLKKDEWGKIIQEDTLVTFSRYFPHKILYKIDTINDKGKDGYYYIDEDKVGKDVTIYGVKDLTFENLAKLTSANNGAQMGSVHSNFGYGDIALAQMTADMNSLYNTGIYIDFEYPNKIKITNSTSQDITRHMHSIEVYLFIKHANNLATISPTKMELFEKLAITDIKLFLYNGLKHYDNLETVYANIDLKISDWSSAESDRENIIEKMADQYVSAANTHQPLMYVF